MPPCSLIRSIVVRAGTDPAHVKALSAAISHVLVTGVDWGVLIPLLPSELPLAGPHVTVLHEHLVAIGTDLRDRRLEIHVGRREVDEASARPPALLRRVADTLADLGPVEITGLSVAEIQEIQGGSLSSVKMRLSRARKALATILGVDEPDSSLERTEVQNQPGLSNQESHFLRFESAAHD